MFFSAHDSAVRIKSLVITLILGLSPVSSLLCNTHPHKSLRNLKVIYTITRLTTDFMCGLMSDLVICKFKRVVIHDTKCPY